MTPKRKKVRYGQYDKIFFVFSFMFFSLIIWLKCDNIIKQVASVVQWIGREIADLVIEVRVPTEAQVKSPEQGGFLFEDKFQGLEPKRGWEKLHSGFSHSGGTGTARFQKFLI